MQIILEKVTGFLLAKTFGVISPAIKIKTVRSMICIRSARSREIFKIGAASRAIVTPKIEAATLISVFPKRIVTSSLLGVSRRFEIYFAKIPGVLFNSLILFLSKENKATSEPEKKADKIKRIIKRINR